jgi:hypothetical protein
MKPNQFTPEMNRTEDLALDFRQRGFHRSPNKDTKWFVPSAGYNAPVFPLELHLEQGLIWIKARSIWSHGLQAPLIPLLRFESVADVVDYLSDNGRSSASKRRGCNVWD